MRRKVRAWSGPEEANLVIMNMLDPKLVCGRFAKSSGRSERSVRVKLCRLLKDPINRPPTLSTASTDAAAPQVTPARGSADTSKTSSD